jgi:hypothetical protein
MQREDDRHIKLERYFIKISIYVNLISAIGHPTLYRNPYYFIEKYYTIVGVKSGKEHKVFVFSILL